jgi:hypothetical protein
VPRTGKVLDDAARKAIDRDNALALFLVSGARPREGDRVSLAATPFVRRWTIATPSGFGRHVFWTRSSRWRRAGRQLWAQAVVTCSSHHAGAADSRVSMLL